VTEPQSGGTQAPSEEEGAGPEGTPSG
jgi:hypothetical protein